MICCASLSSFSLKYLLTGYQLNTMLISHSPEISPNNRLENSPWICCLVPLNNLQHACEITLIQVKPDSGWSPSLTF